MTFSRFLLLLVLLLSLGLPGTPARALQASPASAAPDSVKRPAGPPGVDALEQEPGDDAFRHSASVKAVGRWMHLDKETAAEVFEYFNFALLAGCVLFGLLKYLPKTFRANREDIQRQLVDARTATQEAEQRLAAIEQRLTHLDEEIAAISKQAEKDSAEDEARIRASIEAERQRIVEAVSREIAAAASAAQRDLKRFAAGLAVDRAAQRMTLTVDDDRALVQEFAQNLGRQGSRN